MTKWWEEVEVSSSLDGAETASGSIKERSNSEATMGTRIFAKRDLHRCEGEDGEGRELELREAASYTQWLFIDT